jgi:hypothetical protein
MKSALFVVHCGRRDDLIVLARQIDTLTAAKQSA